MTVTNEPEFVYDPALFTSPPLGYYGPLVVGQAREPVFFPAVTAGP